jgi:hypothetical protein
MNEIYLAVIMVCALNAAPGTPLDKQCVVFQDRTGISSHRTACQGRLDAMWLRLMENTKALTETHKQIGDFRMLQKYQRGFCVNPRNPLDEEIEKYYER